VLVCRLADRRDGRQVALHKKQKKKKKRKKKTNNYCVVGPSLGDVFSV
jgi:hypothetical protein